MKSPYTPKEPVPVRFITEIYLSRLDSRQSQRVIFTEDQFEELFNKLHKEKQKTY